MNDRKGRSDKSQGGEVGGRKGGGKKESVVLMFVLKVEGVYIGYRRGW